MTERIYCETIDHEGVEVKGNSITFKFADDSHTFYLTAEAIVSLLERLPIALYDKMASDNVELTRQLKDVHDVLYGGKK